jgi:hypothetical protein
MSDFQYRRLTFSIEYGAIRESPVIPEYYTSDSPRAKHWLAKISPDPRSPGGLARKFCPRGRGMFRYVVEGFLQELDPIEFGVNETVIVTGLGERTIRRRWYGVVESITPYQLTLVSWEDGLAAYKYSHAMKTTPPLPGMKPPVRKLNLEPNDQEKENHDD